MPHRRSQCPSTLHGLLWAVAILFAGCGGGDGGTSSCTVTESMGSLGNTQVCEEASGEAGSAIEQACKSSNSALPPDAGVKLDVTFAHAPCTHVNAIGGCQLVQSGMTVGLWYYQSPDLSTPLSSTQVQTMCSQMGATYLPP